MYKNMLMKASAASIEKAKRESRLSECIETCLIHPTIAVVSKNSTKGAAVSLFSNHSGITLMYSVETVSLSRSPTLAVEVVSLTYDCSVRHHCIPLLGRCCLRDERKGDGQIGNIRKFFA